MIQKEYRDLQPACADGLQDSHFFIFLKTDKNFEIKLIDYCNSGDSPHAGKSEVVGYNAIAFFDKKEENTGTGEIFSFTSEERKQLFDIVRKTVRSRLYENKKYVIDEGLIAEHLKKPMGAFVTFKIKWCS